MNFMTPNWKKQFAIAALTLLPSAGLHADGTIDWKYRNYQRYHSAIFKRNDRHCFNYVADHGNVYFGHWDCHAKGNDQSLRPCDEIPSCTEEDKKAARDIIKKQIKNGNVTKDITSEQIQNAFRSEDENRNRPLNLPFNDYIGLSGWLVEEVKHANKQDKPKIFELIEQIVKDRPRGEKLNKWKAKIHSEAKNLPDSSLN